MLRRRSSVGYRVKKSRIGKRLMSHTRLLFVLGGVAVALILTVIWGLIWGEQAQESALARTKSRLQAQALAAEIPDWLPTQPAPLQAAYLGKLTSFSEAVASAELLAEGGSEALSIPMYLDGMPQYSSATACTLGRQTEGASDILPQLLFETIQANGCRVAATFACAWQNETALSLRRVARTYEAALVAEIAEAGADEVLLTGLAVTEETMHEVALFLQEIRESCPDAVIGISLPTALMMSDTRVETVRTLLTWADHAALDLSDYATHTFSETDADGTPIRTAATLSQILDLLAPTIRRYQMRLLIPVSMYEQLATVEELGYENWQIIR